MLERLGASCDDATLGSDHSLLLSPPHGRGRGSGSCGCSAIASASGSGETGRWSGSGSSSGCGRDSDSSSFRGIGNYMHSVPASAYYHVVASPKQL